MLEKWKPLCEKYNCTIPALALSWILAQGDYITILSGATTPEQVRENVKAADIRLEEKDIQLLRSMAEELEN